jgi:hypothetical protein
VQNGKGGEVRPAVAVVRPQTNGAPVHAPAPAQRDLPWCEVIRVAADATVDPKTVLRYLDGGPCRDTTKRRIGESLAKCGFPDYVRRTG